MKKNPNINIKLKRAKNGILYDQYGFDEDGFNKDGYDIKFIKGNFLKIKKEKDTLIYLFFCLKCILIIIQKN